MKRTKRLLSLLLALVMVLALAACGTEEPEKMTVRAALVGAPVTLDPARAVTETEKTVAANLYENLMKQTLTGVTAGQASSYVYTDNMDGTETYTFTLRSDIYWSDGRKVAAQDFVYAWQRLVDPETNSPHASILNMVAGYADAVAGDPAALQVWATDNRTLHVTISGHCSYFLSVVCTAVSTMPVRADVAAAAEDETDSTDTQSGDAAREPQPDWSMSAATLLTNGPYAVSSMTAEGVTLTGVEKYYDAKRLGPDEIDFTYCAGTEDAMALYDSGDADFVLDAGEAEGAVEASAAAVSTVLINQMATSLSETVRKAMSMVIDRNALAALAGGSGEVYRAADGLIPYGIVTSDGSSFREANGALIDNDPEQYDAICQAAVELLRGAGYTPTVLEHISPVTLLYENTGSNAKVAQALQTVWRDKLGVRVAARGVTPEEMMTVLKNGEFSLALTNVSGDRNTALSYLNRFSSSQQENYGQFYSNAYDMLIRAAANSSSDEARDAYLADAEAMLLDSGYVMPLYNETYTWLLRDTLTGIRTDGMGVYYFQNVVKAAA